MPDVTLHFASNSTMSPAELAIFSKLLQEKTAALSEMVDGSQAQPATNRIVGVDDVILVLTVGAKLLGAGALSLEVLHRVIVAAKAVAHDLGWTGTLTVEGDGGRVKPEQLTEDDAKFIGEPPAAKA